MLLRPISFLAVLLALWLASNAALAGEQKEANQSPLSLDLKGGSLLWLADGSILKDGQPITCAELKVQFPYLFQRHGDDVPHLTEECQLLPTSNPERKP
jgi:hypothetical protein